MAALHKAQIQSVHHWDDNLFSFTTTRDSGFRFKNGHFTMIGLEQEGRPLLRAYSIASANYEDHLEFFSIKVAEGALTSQLQNLQVGDEIYVSNKPTGSLLTEQLLPGKRLYLLSTGTGLAPFISIIKDPDIYEQYEKIILIHGVRYTSELAYSQLINEHLPDNEYFGEQVKNQLIYYPTVTRDNFKNQGRLTNLIKEKRIPQELGLPPLDPQHDRFMICGGPAMLKETCELLDAEGFRETRNGELGHYVIERAFVE
jgi:ferredoxin--NADP+ reductase